MELFASQVGNTHDGITCISCWGIVAPAGVSMVPEDGELCTCDRAPRHNPVNPILSEARAHLRDEPEWRETLSSFMATFDGLNPERGGWYFIIEASKAERTHARRVLTRLVKLTATEGVITV